MTERRFKVARRLVKNKPWDFFMMVEMGPDRLHHVFWQYCDPRHPLYEPGNKFETAFQDYYRFLDREVGALLEVLPDDAITIVMSDHGARPMMGGLCFNDWLMQEGYLALTETVTEPTPIAKAPIDWSRTIAWGDGGYYGRCFLNVKGREPQGIIEPERYEEVRDELMAKLEAAPGPDGEPLGTKALKPQDVYPEVRGVAPDLLVYFGDLEWRSVGSVGNAEPLHLRERHRSRRGEPRPHGHLRDEEPARAADGPRRRHEPGRRRSHHPEAVRPRGAGRRRRKELPVTQGDKGFTVWFTGLSGAGKSTIAEMLYHELQARGLKTEILDGDVVRQNLSKGLGFSKEDRDTNILRIAFVADLLTRNGVATICCPISPYKETRDAVARADRRVRRGLRGRDRRRRSPSTATPRACTRRRSPGRSPGSPVSTTRTRRRRTRSCASTRRPRTPRRRCGHVLDTLKSLGYIDDATPMIEGDRVHSGLTDLRVTDTGHVAKEA